MITINERVGLLSKLGDELSENTNWREDLIQNARGYNAWFTPEMVSHALNRLVHDFLREDSLNEWIKTYSLSAHQKNVGLILAGNIPLVGVHDIISTFLIGHRAHIKTSSKDQFLVQALVNKLIELDPRVEAFFLMTDQLKTVDALIATGSNNSFRYFEHYFKDVPHLLRKSRSSLAVITGSETQEELDLLAEDIFLYFGLGCRSVSKIFLPSGYDILQVRSSMERWSHLLDHDKYKNNYDYSYAIYMMNKTPFYALGPGVFLESKELHSRISCVHFEYYDDLKQIEEYLHRNQQHIQSVYTSNSTLNGAPLGTAQAPQLNDYADNVDTLQFLSNL